MFVKEEQKQREDLDVGQNYDFLNYMLQWVIYTAILFWPSFQVLDDSRKGWMLAVILGFFAGLLNQIRCEIIKYGKNIKASE